MTLNDETDDTDDDVAVRDELDVVFDILRNSRRRFVIRSLADDGPTSLDALAADLAAATSAQTKTTRISLYQNHLPRMADADVVVWDRDAGQVAPGPDIDQFLEHIPDGEH